MKRAPRDALKAAADRSDTLMERGLAEHRAGNTNKGIGLLRRAAACDPANLSARGNLACVLSDAGRYDEALREFRAVHAKSPSVLTLLNICIVARRMGLDRQALRYAVKARKLDPRDPRPIIEQAKALETLERLDEAAGLLEESEALFLSDVGSLYYGGGLLGRVGRFRAASRFLERCIEAAPDHQKAWSDLGASRIGLREYAKARVAIDRALALNPRDAIALCNLGQWYERKARDLNEALACFERALECDASYEGARDEIARLTKRMSRQRRHVRRAR